MPNESTFVDGIKKYIWHYDANAFFYRPNDARTSGVADLLVFARGQGIAIEAKCSSGLPRDRDEPWLQHDFSHLQVAFLKSIERAGSVAVGLINVLSTGECWLIPALKIKTDMSYNYVKQIGKEVSLSPANQTLWNCLIWH